MSFVKYFFRRWAYRIMFGIISAILIGAVFNIGTIFNLPDNQAVLTDINYNNESGIVTRVIDGDTIEVSFDNGTKGTVRLVGIDTPEVTGSNDTEDWFNLSDDKLKPYGTLAKDYTTSKVLNKRVTLKYDVLAGKIDAYDRILAHVYCEGKNLNILLVEVGLARTYIEGESEIEYLALQQQTYAMNSCIGFWELLCAN